MNEKATNSEMGSSVEAIFQGVKTFITERGNGVDFVLGTVAAVVIGYLVSLVVTDVIVQPILLFLGGPGAWQLFIELVIDLAIVAGAIFIVLRWIDKLKEEDAKLLEEIRAKLERPQ